MSMAPESRELIAIDDDVEFLTEQIAALKSLGARDEVDDEDAYDLSIRWGAALAGRLPRMAHYSSRGQLDDADERRFQSLCDELRAMSPLIERFKLARPELADTPAGDRRASQRKRLFRR